MNYKAHIDIMPHEALLDPQGKAVTQSMGDIGLKEISNVRIGKHITLMVEADSEDAAKAKVDEACKKMLVNAIMEGYTFTITEE